LKDGRFAVADATDHLTPLGNYRRIVSTNLVADRLLVELCEPARIRAVSTASTRRVRDGYRFQGYATINGFGPVEPILTLEPDLVLTNSFGAPGTTSRLRAAGIEVFDLGELRGVESLTQVALMLGELLGAPERARNFLDTFLRHMKGVAAGLDPHERKPAMFLSTLGPDLQGGTQGTSYHDVLVAAGLVDVAATRYRDWPAYSAEQVLALAPTIVVTREGTADGVCHYPGMNHLPACHGSGRIIELPGELLDEPGPAMLDAAEELYRAVYEAPGELRSPRSR
jgi:iron complex transport system substrate-binding protein